MLEKPPSTHFGYREVPTPEKSGLVAEVFHSVASRYDLMNDLMSGGLHRLWKRKTLAECGAREGYEILDVASGTGDLALAFAKQVGKTGRVILTDINDSMLSRARTRLLDLGLFSNVAYVLADAEQLPFASNQFDRITVAFGLRNVTQQAEALRSLYRVLKPGGKCLILEFSRLMLPFLKPLYDFYSFKIIPALGELITKDRQSYDYLVESIRMHPDQQTLQSMMETAGFEDVKYTNMTGGIVALHEGCKY